MIRSGNDAEIQGLITQLGKSTKSLVRTAIELAYFSRGSLSYSDVMAMSAGERELAAEFINHRLEIASKMPNPVF